jgi:hypothetical protein
MAYLELKRHLDKPDAVYSCELFARGEDFVLLRYVSERSARVGDVEIVKGAITFALYREGHGYVTWRMLEPNGRLIGHLFHMCKDLEVGESQVEYLDLMLDLWFSPGGDQTELDREELEAFAEKGLVSGDDLTWIASKEMEIKEGYCAISNELEAMVAGGGD